MILSSYYSDEVPFEEDPLEERAPSEETPLRTIASAHREATEKDELVQERFKSIYRDVDDWVPMEEYPFGPSLFSSVELIANKHAIEGRYLLDTALWSLHPSECFEAAMAHCSRVILVFPAGKFTLTNISLHLLPNWEVMPDHWRVAPRKITYERSKSYRPRTFRLYAPTSFAMVHLSNTPAVINTMCRVHN